MSIKSENISNKKSDEEMKRTLKSILLCPFSISGQRTKVSEEKEGISYTGELEN